MTKITYEEIDSQKTKDLVKQHKSFEIVGLSGRLSSAVSKIENIIETQDLSCRIYTYGRVASAGASFFGGITGVAGVLSTIGMAVHNVATYDPDYEIAKHLVDNKLSVDYKK